MKHLYECECGCGILKITKEDFGNGDEIFIEVYSSLFYELQENWLTRLRKKLGMIWAILNNKEFLLFDITINKKENVDKFLEDMKNL